MVNEVVNEEEIQEPASTAEESETSTETDESETKAEKDVEAEDETEAEVSITTDALKELEEFKSKYYYMAAELDNVRKRNQKERENLLKFGNEKVLSDLLEVVDNLERTLAAIENDADEKVKNIAVGINMVHKQLYETLSRHGLTPIDSIGKTFDPNLHEAMSTEEVEGKESGEVLREFQKGWMLNGRLLRAAKVIVTK